MKTFEFLGLCPIGGETVFNNELKHLEFKLTEKFPGRVFFKETSDVQNTPPTLELKKTKKKLIGVRGNFSTKTSSQASETTAEAKQELMVKKSSSAPSHTVTTAQDKERALFFTCLKANMQCRIADRIGLVLAKFPCKNFDDLFEGVGSIDWCKYFYKDSKVLVEKVSAFNSKLASERSVQSITSKAIYTQLCKKWKVTTLPETGKTVNIRVYIDNDIARIVLDLSGAPLYQRGYRLAGGIAPIRETSAYLLLQLMMWKRKIPLHDPFCGSGTIPLEAFLYAHNIPTGLLRTFAFQDLPIFEGRYFKEGFLQYKGQAINNISENNIIRIGGSDISSEAISLSRANAKNAAILVQKQITQFTTSKHLELPNFELLDIQDLKPQYEEGLLLGNPPYGERIGDEEEAYEVYEKLATTVKRFSTWKKAFITNKERFETIIKAKDKNLKIHKHAIKNGKLDTFLYSF